MKTNYLIIIMFVFAVALATTSSMGADVVSQPIGGEEGYYAISSNPSGAMASVDATSVGLTPTTATVYVTGTPGHTITVTKEGYQPWSQYYRENPPAGGTVTVNAQLIPIPVTLPATLPPGGEKGYYSIQSSPTGSVTFNGIDVGTTPVTVDVSTSGTPGHTIVVTATGYQTWTQSVTGNPAAGQTINIFASLTPVPPQSGNIFVSSSPSGATAILDNGQDSLVTSGTFYNVAPGWHNVQVSMPGFQVFSNNNVQVISGGTVTVNAQLIPIPVTLPATLPPGGEKGYYSIQSSPTGSVTFNGIFVGTTPVTVDVSTTGTPGHTIVVTATGFQTWTRQVAGNPAAGQTINIFASLTPVPQQRGNIFVSSSPSGATAILDNGQDSLVTPGTFRNVAPGWHNVQVSMPWHQLFSNNNVQVTSGGTTNVHASLVPVAQSGRLSISSTPRGAGLYINNIYRGETNQIVGGLSVGRHTVVLRLVGYQTFTNTYSVNAGQTTYASVTMAPLQNPSTGDLQVTSSPSGAAVYLNGNYQGVTTSTGGPLDITDLTVATYTVLLKKSGYQDHTTTVTIVAGQTAQVAATLQSSSAPISGTISAEIQSTPEGADVYINNFYRGVTPLNFQNVPIDTTQTYTVRIEMDGYTPHITSGKATPGQSILINAALSPAATPAPTQPLSPLSVLSALGICGIAAFLFMRKT